MVCYRPITGYRAKSVNDSGKRSIVFKPGDGYIDLPVTIPCGQCIGCRLERSRQWAMRCVNEASLHKNNCFVTLTYDNDNLPSDLSLDKTHFQKFMKRLRKRFGTGVRYFHCGEYGSENYRPHYHACLFNFDFSDKTLWSVRKDVKLYRSPSLEKLWPYGFSTIGDVTFESAAYCARYILKKITGDAAPEHYNGRLPEYVTMSRRPGIGKEWIEKYYKDVYPEDRLIIRNDVICKPPKYYDYIYDQIEPEKMMAIKFKRKEGIKELGDEVGRDRLEVKEEVQKRRAEKLIRPL
nr:MAG: replication initiator protein [Microvirus sp.]